MDTFLDSLENKLRIKNNNDILTQNYIDDINNNLLLPILSKFDMCEEIIKFNEIFKQPYNRNEYNRIFKELVDKI